MSLKYNATVQILAFSGGVAPVAEHYSVATVSMLVPVTRQTAVVFAPMLSCILMVIECSTVLLRGLVCLWTL
jgi:hypothetical protein